MSKKREGHSLNEVAGIVEHEGLGYAIQYYMSGDSIADLVLAKKWDEAKTLLNEIAAMLPEFDYE